MTAASKGEADVKTTFGNAEGSVSVDEVILGVDTHLDLHVAVALDQLGRRLGELTVLTTTRGYERLLRWAEGFGPVGCVGIRGNQQLWGRSCPPPEERWGLGDGS